MKKFFACLLAFCMILSSTAVFAAEENAAEDAGVVSEGAVEESAASEEETPAEPEAPAEGAEAEKEEAVIDGEAKTEEADTAEDAVVEEAVAIDTEAMNDSIIVVNDEKFEIGEGLGKVVAVDGVVFVPIRFIFEGFGFQVSWTEKEQVIMGANAANGAMVVMQVANTLLFYADGTGAEGKLVMEAEIFKNNEEWRTYIPVTAVAELFGYKVGYDAEAQAVALSK